MGEVLTLLLATHTTILTSSRSSIPHGTPSTLTETLAYHSIKNEVRIFGIYLKPRYIFGAGTLDE